MSYLYVLDELGNYAKILDFGPKCLEIAHASGDEREVVVLVVLINACQQLKNEELESFYKKKLDELNNKK